MSLKIKSLFFCRVVYELFYLLSKGKKLFLKHLKLIIFIFSTLLLTQQHFRYIYLIFIFIGSVINTIKKNIN
jgi:hypothetical protein